MIAAARFFPKKRESKTGRFTKRQPMEIVQTIKSELAKAGVESNFAVKRVEDLLARVYFPSVN